MHIEFLIEDLSGKTMLEKLLPRLLPDPCTYAIHAYKGIGRRIPRRGRLDPARMSHRILLENLPKLLAGFGKTFRGYGGDYQAAVVVVCDLDWHDEQAFRAELEGLLAECECPPAARFCFAIEEGEAWLLGDRKAVKAAYPDCKEKVLDSYKQDSICGTWELLADAVYDGGQEELKKAGSHMIGLKKSEWAEKITAAMDVEHNSSPSFQKFRRTVIDLATIRK